MVAGEVRKVSGGGLGRRQEGQEGLGADHHSPSHRFGHTDVLYAEPYWYYGSPQPFYNESHAKLRRHIRSFVDEHFNETAINEMDESGTFPPHLLEAAAKAGLNHLNAPYCMAPLVKQGLFKVWCCLPISECRACEGRVSLP